MSDPLWRHDEAVIEAGASLADEEDLEAVTLAALGRLICCEEC